MISSVSADAHGVRVVTHIIPLEESDPVQNPIKSEEVEEKPEVPYMTRMFLKGEPVALGVSTKLPLKPFFMFISSIDLDPVDFRSKSCLVRIIICY